jgi:hypothetical protein
MGVAGGVGLALGAGYAIFKLVTWYNI